MAREEVPVTAAALPAESRRFGVWEEWMRLGIPEIDNDHQQILAACDLMADVLAGRDRATAEPLMDSLMGRISQHLALEERVLRDEDCPLTDEHASHHDRVRATLKQLHEDFLGGRQCAETVLHQLKALFVGSLIAEDLACKPYLSRRATASAPAVIDSEISSLVEYLKATHGAGAGAIADAVCASAEAAGNCRQAELWRQIRAEVSVIARP